MSCESLIFTANAAAQTVAAATTVASAVPLSLGTGVRRRKIKCHPNINLSGTSGIAINGGDYYSIIGEVTVTPTAAGTVTVSLLQDGAVVSSQTAVTGAAATSVPIPILGEVRTRGGSTILTVVVTGAAGTASNLYLRVKED